MGKPDDSLAVDDEQRGTLAQGNGFTLHAVLEKHLAGLVGKQGERVSVLLGVGLGSLRRVGRDGEDLRSRLGELLLLGRQLAEMPAAERSAESPKEDQDNAPLSPKVAQGDRAAVGR